MCGILFKGVKCPVCMNTIIVSHARCSCGLETLMSSHKNRGWMGDYICIPSGLIYIPQIPVGQHLSVISYTFPDSLISESVHLLISLHDHGRRGSMLAILSDGHVSYTVSASAAYKMKLFPCVN